MTRVVLLSILVIIGSIISGQGCGSLAIHPSHNASYISGNACIISNTGDLPNFKKMAAWCVEQKESGR